MKYWIKAARLRTLPLALSGIIMGGFLAPEETFDLVTFLMCVLTAILLQILSNFANDLGDFKRGTDVNRKGEARMVQSGHITPGAMKKAVMLFSGLSLLSGLALLYTSPVSSSTKLIFLFIGIGAIAAAILYTNGRKPYGYAGLGDAFVLIFFGWVAVTGTFFIVSAEWNVLVFLPATGIGMLAVAVLNLNNLRDMENDRIAGKRSIPVRIGLRNALNYQAVLMFIPFLLFLLFFTLNKDYQNLAAGFSVVMVPVFFGLYRRIRREKTLQALDAYLKWIALGTLMVSLIIGVGILVASHYI